MAEEPQVILKSRDILLQSAVAQIYEQEHKKKKKAKRKRKHEDVNFDIPGVTKIIISPTAQKNIECVVGQNVTVENPWKYVSKEAFEDNLEYHKGDSDLLSIKKELLNYPRSELLLGYIPDESRDYDEFYVCLTEPAEEAVSEIIAQFRKQREEKLNNIILKGENPWKTQDSELEVELLIIKNNRALLEIEIETQYPVISTKSQFRSRMAEDVRDGYVELLPGRNKYVNILKRRIDVCVQVAPAVNSAEAQTVYTYPINAWVQYEYKYEPVVELSSELQGSVKSFVDKNIDFIEDMICVNSNIDFFKDDYISLVKDKRWSRVVDVTKIKECISFIDIEVCEGKMITCVSQHPMWMGIIAIAYSHEPLNVYRSHKPSADEVTKALYDVAPVLLWSFADSLRPKLYLETPREVTTISFCPFYEDLLIGGCANGQVIVWDIKNRLSDIDMKYTFTSVSQKYRDTTNGRNFKTVEFTAISDLTFSHKSAVSEIQWISPFLEITTLGEIKNLSENGDKKSLQFMSTSKDGMVLFWDLQIRPLIRIDSGKPSKKQSRIKKLPSALLVDESSFKRFNKILKPLFRVDILAPEAKRNLLISGFSTESTPFEYEECSPDPLRKFNITQCIHYKPILTKPIHTTLNRFVATTVEGDFLVASWEQLDYDPEESLNKQTCKLEKFVKFHDGPVVSLSRCEVFHNIILTVGGKVFALWRIDFMAKPIFWRKCKHRYTHGVWNTHRPSIFGLTRDDGYLEIWHLKTRSNQYEEIQPISAGSLNGTYTHSISQRENLMGAADSNNSFRLFHIPQRLSQKSEEDIKVFNKFCEREVERKLVFMKWQDQWKQNNAEWLNAKIRQNQKLQKQKEEELKKKKRKQEELQKQCEKEEAMNLALMAKPEPGKFKEWADRQWRQKEQKRLCKVLLGKKSLDREFLEERQLPLTNMAKEEASKRKKQENRLKDAEKLFTNSAQLLFPDATGKEPSPTPDPYAGGDLRATRALCYKNYLETVKQCEEIVSRNRFVYDFNWQNFLKEGKERRKYLDGHYSRPGHKNRLLRS